MLENSDFSPKNEGQIDGPGSRMRIGIGIATRGRPEILRRVVDSLSVQILPPNNITVVGTAQSDVDQLEGGPSIQVFLSKPGLAKQRNAIIDHIGDNVDIVVFFDDDFIAHPNWIDTVERIFACHPEIACITGNVIADGIKGPGFTFDQAGKIIDDYVTNTNSKPKIIDVESPYGCNMAFRMSAIEKRRFDERLVLYGWLEDRDFGASLLSSGWRVVKTQAAIGVHLGDKKGRMAGRRLGYSQIINPIYLKQKGTMSASAVRRHIINNFAANAWGAITGDSHVDRKGRLSGNCLGVLDAVRGRLNPERAEQL